VGLVLGQHATDPDDRVPGAVDALGMDLDEVAAVVSLDVHQRASRRRLIVTAA
jgi:hypothetical protein